MFPSFDGCANTCLDSPPPGSASDQLPQAAPPPPVEVTTPRVTPPPSSAPPPSDPPSPGPLVTTYRPSRRPELVPATTFSPPTLDEDSLVIFKPDSDLPLLYGPPV